MTARHEEAWSQFWASSAAGGGQGGCLPEGWRGIEAAQRDIWREFARALPRGARTLDLATGDGRVMRWLLEARRDLKPVGTDLAPKLPPPPRGTRLRPGVAMESLPFPDGRFAAVTSQFGFEYGDVVKIAGEIARVLAPRGKVALLMHRGDGPILTHNVKRGEQIRWVLDEQELVEKAKQFLARRLPGLATVTPEISAAPVEGARRFGEGSVGWEIAEAVRRTLVMGAQDTPTNVAALLDTIAGHARNELGRIDSLTSACGTADDEAALATAFTGAGLAQVDVRPVCEPGRQRPFATLRLLQRG